MPGIKQLFQRIDNSHKVKVRLSDKKEVEAEGTSTVLLQTSNGKKLLHGVHYVPKLAHNLLSVGQLMIIGYVMTFEKETCIIEDRKSRVRLVTIQKTQNNVFPLLVDQVKKTNMAEKSDDISMLWHKRYGHLNCRSLNMSHQ